MTDKSHATNVYLKHWKLFAEPDQKTKNTLKAHRNIQMCRNYLSSWFQ